MKRETGMGRMMVDEASIRSLTNRLAATEAEERNRSVSEGWNGFRDTGIVVPCKFIELKLNQSAVITSGNAKVSTSFAILRNPQIRL